MATTPDVLIIGGGIIGSATAYHLARRGASVTLLEASSLAYGATGRNLGYIWVHTRRPGPELELVMHLRRELEGLPEELGAEFGLRTDGGLLYVHTEAQLATLREFVAGRQADGVDIRMLDGDEARSMAPILPDSVIGASFCPSTPRWTRPAMCGRSRPPRSASVRVWWKGRRSEGSSATARM